jgi:hypothetical protein
MCATTFERGQLVVIQTDRGVELGEVLVAVECQAVSPSERSVAPAANRPTTGSDSSAGAHSQQVIRAADPDDLSRSKLAAEARESRFALCQRILREEGWPWELIEVDPLLDGRATVINYLGPHRLDVASLRARFRVECDIDVILEPVGSDLESADGFDEAGGSCGSCGCGEGGGCGAATAEESGRPDHSADPDRRPCTSSSHSGCSSCGISRLLAERTRARP